METILSQLRAAGWSVAGHHDETVRGRLLTTWKMADGKGRMVVGEGPTDAEALSQIRSRIGLAPDATLEDAGPWTAGADSRDGHVFLQSEDFTHDARLYVDGDFAKGDAMRYAERLAARMNAMPSASEGAAS